MKLNYVICDAKIIDNEDVNELCIGDTISRP